MVISAVYYEGQEVYTTVTPILVNSGGKSLLADTPLASFISIVYSVNDGPHQAIDVPAASAVGLNAGKGDVLTIHEVWYHSKMVSSDEPTQSRLEAYLTNRDEGHYNSNWLCKTDFDLLEQGVNSLELKDTRCNHDDTLSQFSWIIPDDQQELILTYITKHPCCNNSPFLLINCFF